MLMAAGLGTRLRPFTDSEPKALMPVLDIPIAQFALDSAVAAGVQRIVANIHHHPERAGPGLLALPHETATLELSDESALLLGSGGGLRKALPRFEGKPFFLLNADVLCDIDLTALALQHQHLRARHGVRLTLAVFSRAPGSGKYREILFSGENSLIAGLGDLQAGQPFFIGAAVLEADALTEAPTEGAFEFVPHVLEPAIRAQKAGAFITQGSWFDVGNPALWLEAHLGLIDRLETGRIAPRWRKRIESVNKRLAPGIWVSSSSQLRHGTAEWVAPCYWSRSADTCADLPRTLGARAVLYGQAPRLSSETLQAGIGFKGQWVPCP
jgi:MurNAc alpha-1-phosphate uridylyltransferase